MVFMIKYTIIITDAAGKKVVKLRETFSGARTTISFAGQNPNVLRVDIYRGISDRAPVPDWEYNELTKGTKFKGKQNENQV